MPTLRWSTALPALLVGFIACSVHAAGAPSTVVASQGGVDVTLADIDAFASRMPEKDRAGYFRSPTRIENTITSLLLQRQLASDARKLGLDKDAEVASQFALAEEEVLARARMARYRAELKMPDFGQLAQEDYIAHKEKFAVPAGLAVLNVLITTTDRSQADADALAAKVEAEARAHPDQFEALVDKYSDDPSKTISHGRVENAADAKKYAPEFAAASAALKKVGDISPVVKTTHGLHVIKLVERTAARTRPFAEVKEEIIQRLRSDYIDKQMRTYTDTLRNLPLDANPELVASLRDRYGAADPASQAKQP
jgi:peptidyl-prolyl cis-trans isomerase C